MRLESGINTNVVLTLTEKVTIDTSTFLFEFESLQSHTKYYFIAADTSSYPERYNKFTITVKTSPNALLGEVNLPQGDDYKYTVYEQESATNLDPDLTGEIVETGYLTYEKTLNDRTEYSNDTTRAVWEG